MSRRKSSRIKVPKDKGTRMCCSCRERAPRNDLLRFVLDSQGKAWLDPYLKAPGRGAHLCYRKSCIERALKKRSLSTSFKCSVTLPEEEELMKLLVEAQLSKISNLIGLARRRGELISGLNILSQAQEEVSLLIFSSDIAETSKEKLMRTFKVDQTSITTQAPFLCEQSMNWARSNKTLLNWIDSIGLIWNGEALGGLIGKAHRVAIGLTQDKIARQVEQEILRISQVLVATSSL